ncbi:F-box/WD repeat-containing protein [Aspergillus novofumigatus IBT 16806]|uniref:Probable E3 ubiquitin ligase complex SCF subunit sconB n=1 Tax=Aspergillus novofumigatus (strain IBT 16806) TaxID=1392255 RepID=A0A2I1CBQ0_ASPN1|nr:putative cell division control protein Cdc4 [Aspergillus novofumigatus IBT 16806]PKX95016.1 putative cell division control protein Cdc4 [Aspergillus novofumigatus IBT 16806]
MEQLDANNDLDHRATNSTIGQFSFAPATRTTVVTTTTTTTTTFPPLVIKSPRATRDLDPKLYPLASSPTPTSLRNIKFELGGKTVVFNEPVDATVAIKEVNETNNALKASNGFVQSVTSYTTLDNAQTSRRLASARLSSQPSNPSSAKRRPASVVDSHQSSTRLRPGRLPSEPSFRQIRPHLSSATYTAGLATPETESSGYNLSDYAMPRRRVHSAAIPRRETLLRSPLSSEVESQEVLQDPGAESVLGKAELRALRAKAAIWEGDRHLSRHRDNASSRPSPQLATPTVNGDGAAGVNTASQGTDYDGSEESFQQAPTEPASQISAIENLVAHDMCLPSPSLSPVAALNAMNVDSSFESAEDQEMDTDSSLDNNASRLANIRQLDDSKNHDLSPSRSGNLPVATENRHTSSLMDIPSVLEFFDSVPEELKTYLMYQFLRRCPKPTLHFVADVVNPALKCDFLALLPLELSLNIVKYFDVQTMCRAAQVSKKWRHIINSDEKTWKDLFDRDGYVLTDGELERAIKEGWGWQFPHGDDDWEKDLSSSAVIKPEPDCASGSAFSSLPGESDERALSVSRRPKRKATRISGRKYAKRKISSSNTDSSDSSGWRNGVTATEGPYAAANAAAAAVPYPEIGLPSLRGLHLFKSLYQRHHSIHKGWMKPNVKPKHIAFRAHDRHVVTCLQFDTDKVLTGSDDTNINVYDTKTGALRATLEGHEGGVWALEYHGNTLVSGSTDRSVRVWDIERARCTQIFHGHTSTVRCLQIVLPVQVGSNADGTPEMMPKEPIIITGSRDSSLRVWKLPKPGDPVYYQSGPHADDTDCPYFIRVLTGHQHSVRAIAAHGDTLVSGSYDCTVRVWKISTGETIHRLQGHTLKVYSVVLDHKRNRCISGSMDNTVKVWSLDTGSIIYNLEGHSSLVGLLDLKCDRLVSAAADSTLRIWDPETGQCKSRLSAHTGAITCFQHDGQKVISGSDRTLKMWDVRNGECVRDLLTDLSGVWQVKFNDRRCVAAVQRDALTYIEVLDFGASRDGVPEDQLGRRIVVNRWGQEIGDNADEDYDLSDG